ncbi:hypothetical protein M0R45_031379 [Rubus argutus]|uniref:RING-type E3 ubiquitin transferase n=1 Tax=Rubus argutus TaxID=59490 RepID=A0AAW1WDX9_RUBAR
MQKMLLMNFLWCWLVIIVIVLHVDIMHGGVGPKNCTAIRCKRHGPEIVPISTERGQPIHCGYPGFDVSCTKDKQTVLETTPSSADNFLVNRINYTAQEIEIYLYNNHYDYVKDFKDICIPKQIFDLSSSPFQYSDAQMKINYTVFSCPPSDQKDRYPSFCPLAKLSPCGVGNHSNKIYALNFSCSEIHYMP